MQARLASSRGSVQSARTWSRAGPTSQNHRCCGSASVQYFEQLSSINAWRQEETATDTLPPPVLLKLYELMLASRSPMRLMAPTWDRRPGQ